MKGRILEKTTAVLCALGLAVGVMSGVVFARDEEPSEELPADPEATFVVLDWEDAAQQSENAASASEAEDPASEEAAETPAVEASAVEVTDNRTEIPFYVGDAFCGELPILGGAPAAPAYDFCRALGLNPSATLADGVYAVTAEGVDIRACEGDIYFTCNGRYILVPDGVQIRDGQACLPVEALAKCLGTAVSWDRVSWTVTAAGDSFSPLESGDDFYDETDVYWLSRVIYAEAGDQSMRGQIGVGNVVMHRIESDQFPGQDNVYDVIFAKNQFDVVANGMIYMEPGAAAVAAAKLALEGYDVTGGALYFASFFFGDGFECVLWIDDHCFMVEA